MTWQSTDSGWRASLGYATATVSASSGRLSIGLAGGGDVTVAAGDGQSWLRVLRDGRWRSVGEVEAVSADGDTCRIQWADGAHASIRVGPVSLTISVATDDAAAVEIATEAALNEQFFGLGERFDAVNQTGKIVDLLVTNGATGGVSYKPIPWLLSNRGYGVSIDESAQILCSLAHVSDPQVASIRVMAPSARISFFPSDSMSGALSSYTSHIGRPPVPPDWMFLPWLSGDWRHENQESVLHTVRTARELDIPLGVKLIDAMWEDEDHSFRFDTTKYPDPHQMVRQMKSAGVETVIWLSPSMTEGGDTYTQASDRGLLIKNTDGESYRHLLGNQPGWYGTTIDFTNPEAVELWQRGIRSLMEMGVAGVKTDFGEQVPLDAVFSDGTTGATGHNLLPYLYNQATWEVVREYDGIQLARSGWAGCQAIPAIWAGDQSSDTNPGAGLGSVIVAAQSSGLSGYPYWGSDIGGYYGEPTEELYLRWAQFAALTPIMQVHGLGKRQPWEFSDEARDIYREAALLHVSLLPYFRALSSEAARTGLPLVRAMVLEFPDCSGVFEHWVQFQFMLGSDLLVAPLYFQGNQRTVLFPDGQWTNWFDSSVVQGPCTARVSAPLESFPLFIRNGAVIPVLSDPTDILSDYEVVVCPSENRDGSCRLGNDSEIALGPAVDGLCAVTVSGDVGRELRLRAPRGWSAEEWHTVRPGIRRAELRRTKN